LDDRSSLLEQLRIEHSEPPWRRGAWLWWLGGTLALAAGAAFGWQVYAERQRVPVTLAVAEQIPQNALAGAGTVLDASGYVVARRKATVSSKITGKVVEVAIEEGQRVTEGQVIARLDDANARAALAQAAAQRDQARANLVAATVAFDNAIPTFERNEVQLAHAVISAQAFDTAKATFDSLRTSLLVAERAVEVAETAVVLAERNLEDTIVRAPFAGIVTVKAAQEGEMVSPISAGGGFTRTGIGTIVDMGSLEVEVDVSENFIHRVQAGQSATATLNAYPDWRIPARVIAIIPTADRAKATVKVRIGFDARDPRILPEMGVRVAFLSDGSGGSSAQPAVAVPADAVQTAGENGIVFVVAGDALERRTVRLGERLGERQIVLSGLTAGTRVARGDRAVLADGVKIRIEE
jgi:RND family efflux transporter MFP subunit